MYLLLLISTRGKKAKKPSGMRRTKTWDTKKEEKKAIERQQHYFKKQMERTQERGVLKKVFSRVWRAHLTGQNPSLPQTKRSRGGGRVSWGGQNNHKKMWNQGTEPIVQSLDKSGGESGDHPRQTKGRDVLVGQ